MCDETGVQNQKHSELNPISGNSYQHKFDNGGDVVDKNGNPQPDASNGGFADGKSHAKGGIKGVNKSSGQPLEFEGGEVIITEPAVADDTKREFEGQMLTNREILSKINESGGGVSFADGGEIKEFCYCGNKFQFGGETIEDYKIVQKMQHLYNNRNIDPVYESLYHFINGKEK